MSDKENRLHCTLPFMGGIGNTQSLFDVDGGSNPDDYSPAGRWAKRDKQDVDEAYITDLARAAIERPWMQAQEKRTPSDLIFAAFNDIACTEFDADGYKAATLESYTERVMIRALKFAPELSCVERVGYSTYDENMAICVVELAEIIVEFNGGALAEALRKLFARRPDILERLLEWLHQRWRCRDGYTSYVTCDRDAWREALLNFDSVTESADGRYEYFEGDRVCRSSAIGALLEICAYDDEWRHPEDPTDFDFSDIHPLYYEVCEDTGGHAAFYLKDPSSALSVLATVCEDRGLCLWYCDVVGYSTPLYIICTEEEEQETINEYKTTPGFSNFTKHTDEKHT